LREKTSTSTAPIFVGNSVGVPGSCLTGGSCDGARTSVPQWTEAIQAFAGEMDWSRAAHKTLSSLPSSLAVQCRKCEPAASLFRHITTLRLA
jgi:hypothetical protein